VSQGDGDKQGPSEEAILAALRNIQDPDLHRDIVSLGFVRDINVCGGNVALKIVLTTPACPVRDLMRDQAVELLSAHRPPSRARGLWRACATSSPLRATRAV